MIIKFDVSEEQAETVDLLVGRRGNWKVLQILAPDLKEENSV